MSSAQMDCAASTASDSSFRSFFLYSAVTSPAVSARSSIERRNDGNCCPFQPGAEIRGRRYTGFSLRSTPGKRDTGPPCKRKGHRIPLSCPSILPMAGRENRTVQRASCHGLRSGSSPKRRLPALTGYGLSPSPSRRHLLSGPGYPETAHGFSAFPP